MFRLRSGLPHWMTSLSVTLKEFLDRLHITAERQIQERRRTGLILGYQGLCKGRPAQNWVHTLKLWK